MTYGIINSERKSHMTNEIAPYTQLTKSQAAAQRFILSRVREPDSVTTLAGHAGTGKTFLIGRTLEALADTGWRILLTAPTHQALAVARERAPSGVLATTIHSALGLVVRENDDGSTYVTSRSRPKLLGYDLIVVDEASMVGAEIYQSLMRERQCAVLFVGDPGQLPPVKETESPAFTEVAARVTLTEIVRQAEGSPLIQVAHRIRHEAENGRRVSLDILRELSAGGDFLLDSGGLEKVAELVADAHREGLVVAALTHKNNDVDRINAIAHNTLHPDSIAYAPGERILFRAPHQEKDADAPLVRTNEVGTVIETTDPYSGPFGVPAVRITLGMSGRVVSVPAPLHASRNRRSIQELYRERRRAKQLAKLAKTSDERDALYHRASDAARKAATLRHTLADIQHAYAMTAHRAQGSTVDVAILYWRGLDSMKSDFEHARAVYVAATRPSRYLVIVE